MANEYEKFVEATVNEVKAQEEYRKLVEQFVSAVPITPGKSSWPRRVLDSEALKELQKADKERIVAEAAAREALHSYYQSRHTAII